MYYPINVDIREKDCLVVGGGKTAQRKIESLILAGGIVRVVAPKVSQEIQEWADRGKITLKLRSFQADDVADSFLVIGATDAPAVHDEIVELCRKQNKLVNIVDVPSKCNFTVPSVVRRGKFMLTISTDGASPGFSKRIRKQLEQEFGEEYGIFLDWMTEIRQKVIKEIPHEEERKRLFEALIYSDVLDKLIEKREQEARVLFDQIVNDHGLSINQG